MKLQGALEVARRDREHLMIAAAAAAGGRMVSIYEGIIFLRISLEATRTASHVHPTEINGGGKSRDVVTRTLLRGGSWWR